MTTETKEEVKEYRANFLWPHAEDSVEQAGYEFANGKTEIYRKHWWGILKARAAKSQLAQLTRERDALRDACEMAVGLIDHSSRDAFKNGNTDSTGSIDEGDVLAGRIYDQLRAALAMGKEK